MRKQKDRTYQANSKLKSIEFQNKNIGAQIAVGGAMATTAKAMGEMNKIVRPEAIGADMRAFQQANMKMEMTDEMSKFCATVIRRCKDPHSLSFFFCFEKGLISSHLWIPFCSEFCHYFPLCFFVVNDSLDDMLADSGDEEETNAIVDKVLDEIGIEVSGKVCIICCYI